MCIIYSYNLINKNNTIKFVLLQRRIFITIQIAMKLPPRVENTLAQWNLNMIL